MTPSATSEFGHLAEAESCEPSARQLDLGTRFALSTTDLDPIVTVVIPCYNQAHYLGDALRSVVDQGYTPVEMIVVDDGSTDDSAEVALGAGITPIRQPNAGLGAARNVGLAAARGEFVVFLDADDRLLPDAVASGVATLTASPKLSCVVRRCQLMDAKGRALAANYYTGGSNRSLPAVAASQFRVDAGCGDVSTQPPRRDRRFPCRHRPCRRLCGVPRARAERSGCLRASGSGQVPAARKQHVARSGGDADCDARRPSQRAPSYPERRVARLSRRSPRLAGVLRRANRRTAASGLADGNPRKLAEERHRDARPTMPTGARQALIAKSQPADSRSAARSHRAGSLPSLILGTSPSQLNWLLHKRDIGHVTSFATTDWIRDSSHKGAFSAPRTRRGTAPERR